MGSNPNPDPSPNPHPDPHPDPDPNPSPNPNPDPDPNPNPNPNPDPNPNPNSIPNPNPNPNQGRPPRWRVAGLVHVYLAPHARGTPGGAALMRGARRCLRRMGISHEFTLADDTGSGKLRRWCAA